MALRNISKLIFLTFITFLAPAVSHSEDLIQTDIKTKSIQDHPNLKRFEGSVLVDGDKRAFDEFNVALSKVEFDYSAQDFKPWKKEKVEGARHTTYYRMPKDVTTLEALRNYENDLTGKGFEVLWKASKEELDNGYGRFVTQVYNNNKDNTLMEYIFPAANDYRYVALKKTNDDGSSVYVTGLFTIVTSGWDSKFAGVGDCIARIDVIETKAMGNHMVTVKAEEMDQQIKTAGKVALYGILFDTNSADIKPASEPTLQEISKYLASQPDIKVLVVGHTDSVGGFESNRTLSERRAKSVVAALSEKYGVKAERLFPFGVSLAAPVASNDTEEGRAKNRRVELVKY